MGEGGERKEKLKEINNFLDTQNITTQTLLKNEKNEMKAKERDLRVGFDNRKKGADLSYLMFKIEMEESTWR